MQQYFLTIVDKTVGFCFESEGESEAKKSFLKQYRSYLTASPAVPPDMTIIAQRVYKHTFMQQKNKSFISLFHEKNKNTLVYSENQSDYLNQIFFKIVIQMMIFRQKLFIVHASSCLINGRAVLFTGKSGAGKSTIVKLLQGAYRPLCDDMAILQKKDKELYLYQVPYEEKNRYPKSNKPYPVSHIYVLKKHDTTEIKAITELNNFDALVKVCGNMFVPGNRKKIAGFVFGMHNRIYELSFPLHDPDTLVQKIGRLESARM